MAQDDKIREVEAKIIEILKHYELDKTIEGLTVVLFDPEHNYPGNTSDILGGVGDYIGPDDRKLVPLEECPKCETEGRKFEGIRPFALVKLSGSPGSWCPWGSVRGYCPPPPR